MDQCAIALLAFPPQSDDADNEAYHQAALLHIQRTAKMVKERAKDLVAFSAELLNVLSAHVCLLPLLLTTTPGSRPGRAFALLPRHTACLAVSKPGSPRLPRPGAH